MKTISAEAFKNQYGEQQYNLANHTLAASKVEPGLFSRIGSDIQSAGENVRSAALGEGQYADAGVLNRATGMVAGAFNAIPAVASEFLPKPIRQGVEAVGQGIGSAVNYLGEKLGNVPAVTKFVTENPEAAKKLIDSLGVVQNVGQISGDILTADMGVKGIQKGVDLTKQGIQSTGNAIGNIGGEIRETATGVKNKVVSMAEKPIEKPVQQALSETPTATFDKYAQTAKEAALSNKNSTPLEVAGQSAQKALNTIQEQLNNIGKLKRGAIESFGDKPVGNIATSFAQNLEKELSQGNFIEGDVKLVKTLVDKAKSLGKNPSATAVDDFIDYAQNELYSGKRNLTVPVTDATTGLLRKYLGELNSNLKSQLPKAYAKLNDMYSEKIGIRDELNTKLGAEGERGGALMKRVFSPSDANTKKLFSQVLKLTGVDLVNEATIAKFLMETVGDARQVSMLEKLQLPTMSKTGLLQLARDWIQKRVNTPEQIMQRARELTKSQ